MSSANKPQFASEILREYNHSSDVPRNHLARSIEQRLKIAVEQYLRETMPVQSNPLPRLMVRVYADLVTLENHLLCPLQKFVVDFSSIGPYFDMVSVRDGAIVEQKIAGKFSFTLFLD